MLYQADMAGLEADATLATHWANNREPDDGVRAFAERLVRAVLGDLSTIDTLISSASLHWALARMSGVDRNILRLAVAEMRSEPETPAPVVIDEAVELARSYGESESQAFVNGVLEAIRKRLLEGIAEAPAAGEPQ
jgi:N utilization substance protein B